MGQALYRKYRSKTFKDVVGQEHITQTLVKAIKNGRISHAYLFSGPRGVGKTTVARILASEVNGLDYNDDSQVLDIIEIDAASNRRIDEIRELRQRVHTAPSLTNYKVYIIDEVHMLTREAFNALLKTLEEPPAHCIFILATTEPHKLPETIISRTQHFKFRPINLKDAEKHLKSIANSENIAITPDAINLIAQHGSGSFRDSISLLDQLGGVGGEISVDTVHEVLGLPPRNLIDNIIANLNNGDRKELLGALEDLWGQGVNPSIIASQLSAILRSQLLETGSEPWLVQLLKQLINVPASNNPRDLLEILLLEAADSKTEVGEITPPKNKTRKVSTTPHVTITENQKDNEIEKVTITNNVDFSESDWPNIVTSIKSNSNTLSNVLGLAKPKVENNELTLYFEFPLHQKRAAAGNNIATIEKVIMEATGAKVIVKCEVNKSIFSSKTVKVEPANALHNIFGPVEMLES